MRRGNLKAALFFGFVGYLIFLSGKKIMTNDDEQIEYMARTMWGEARGEGINGIRAIGHVIMNRAKSGIWYGATPKEVVLKKWQFSCWNDNDPNSRKCQIVTTVDAVFSQCLNIATLIFKGKLADITGGANHYHAANIRPSWADDSKRTATIGNHIFYKL